MTFSVNGIKQEKNERHMVEMLVCVDAPLLARKILEQKNILILSLKEFSQDKKTFGDIYFTIKFNFQEIDIVTKYEDIQKACNFFSFIGFDILYINSYYAPISSKEMIGVINKARNESIEKKIQDREKIQKKEEQEKKVYEDVDLQAAKKIIFRVFEKVEETVKRSTGTIPIKDMKKIQSLTEELRKLRMGTNFEKTRDTIKELFDIIERINKQRYRENKNPNDIILKDSLVTTQDVNQEMERMENVKMLKSLHANIPVKNKDYVFFGSSAIFWKFIQKDILYKLADPGTLLYNFYDIIEFIVLIIVVLLGVYTVANEIYLFSMSQFGLAFLLISIGMRGIICFGIRQIKKISITRLFLFIPIAIVLHYVLMWIVTTNFAL